MTISYLAAFLGGLVSLISPCSTLVIPSFLAAVGGQKKRLLWSTLLFGLGLMTVLIPLSLGIVGLNGWFNLYRKPLTSIIGFLLLASGIFILSGKELMSFNTSRLFFGKKKHGKVATVYLLGLISGLGSTACIGPILGAIITLSFASSTLIQATMLLLSYGLGILLPFVLLSLTYDRFAKNWLRKYYTTIISIGRYRISLHNLITGSLLVGLGYIFIRHQGNMAATALFSKTPLLDITFTLQELLFEI